MITFGFDWIQVLTFILAVCLPLLVGLVTKFVTHSGTRAILLALFSAVVGILNELVVALTHGTAYDLDAAIITWLGIFVVAVAIHFGVWKPTGVSDKAKNALGGAAPLPAETRSEYNERNNH